MAYEAVQLGEKTWYIPAAVNIGIVVEQDEAVIIDSGSDKEAGRQILKVLETHGWRLRLIVNTHSNADHIGGNAFLQNKTGCAIAATRTEAAFIGDPVLETAFLWGSRPFEELDNKFLRANPSQVTDIVPSRGVIPGTDLQTVPLPGHFLEMIGVITPDRVFFVADSVFGDAILQKYHVTFIYDVEGFLETLSELTQSGADLFVPSHAAPAADISPLAEANRRKVLEVRDTIAGLCRKPQTFEDILAALCGHYRIALNSTQYVLIGSTLKAYISYLLDRRELRSFFDNGRMYWQLVT